MHDQQDFKESDRACEERGPREDPNKVLEEY